jgi:hypothetical protein
MPMTTRSSISVKPRCRTGIDCRRYLMAYLLLSFVAAENPALEDFEARTVKPPTKRLIRRGGKPRP